MKKISWLLSVTVVVGSFALLASCNNSNTASSSNTTTGSSGNFEGVVTYVIKAGSGLPAEVTSMLDSMKMKTYVKNNFTRTEEAMAGNQNIVIADSKNPDDPIMLISMFGHKYAVKRNDSMKKLEAANVPKIEYIDSANCVKAIAGYSCKKARITSTQKEGVVTTDVYYTTDLPYADPQGQFKGLKGMPMEFSVSMSGLNIIISAKSVEKKNLSDSLFLIPSDYKLTDLNDLQKALAKDMGGQDSASKGK
jgi:GLPGLI family protein